MLVDLLRRTRLDKLDRLLPGARVDVRARPDLAPTRVVENHPLAHRRCRDCGDGVGAGSGCLERLADACADERPVALRVEDLRARNAQLLGVRVLALADCDLVSLQVEEHGTAGAGSCVDREQQLVAQASTAWRLITLRSGSPAANRLISSATIVAPRSSVSCVAPPMCGVRTTFSCRSSGCGPLALRGRTTSSAAPASRPDESASSSASSSTSVSRAVLTK